MEWIAVTLLVFSETLAQFTTRMFVYRLQLSVWFSNPHPDSHDHLTALVLIYCDLWIVLAYTIANRALALWCTYTGVALCCYALLFFFRAWVRRRGSHLNFWLTMRDSAATVRPPASCQRLSAPVVKVIPNNSHSTKLCSEVHVLQSMAYFRANRYSLDTNTHPTIPFAYKYPHYYSMYIQIISL